MADVMAAYFLIGVVVTVFYALHERRLRVARPTSRIVSVCVWPAYLAGFLVAMGVNFLPYERRRAWKRWADGVVSRNV